MTVNETQHGHLLLADISGYTSYVASTELTHSQEIDQRGEATPLTA